MNRDVLIGIERLHLRQLGLSNRVAGVLLRSGCSMAEIRAMSDQELVLLRNSGPSVVAEIRRVIPEGPGLWRSCPTCEGIGRVRVPPDQVVTGV